MAALTSPYNPPADRVIHTTQADFVSRSGFEQPVYIVQGDMSLPIVAVELYKNGERYAVPAGASGNIRWKKPNPSLEFCYNPLLGLNADRTVAYFEISQQMAIVYGEPHAVIEIKVGEDVAGSSKLPIYIDKNPIQEGDIESSSEGHALKDYVDAAAKSASDAKGSADAAKASQTAAAGSASNAATSASAAATSATESEASATQSAASATEAGKHAAAAKASQTAAAGSASNAATSASAAATSATESSGYANQSKTSATQSAASATEAGKHAAAAKASEDLVGEYAKQAKASETTAGEHAAAAKASEDAAAKSASGASASATQAANSASGASTSATQAANSATAAAASAKEIGDMADLSKSYAVGGTGVREGENADNSKYYYEQAKGISQGLAGSLLPMGTVAFAQLQNQTKESGYMYNISDAFTTDVTFKEGAGHRYPAGTNVYYTADGYWDCLAGTMVTSVNGEIGDVKTVKTVNGVKGDVTLGIRNLLLNSGVKIGPSDAYSIAAYTFGNEKPIEGETYTVTLKGTLGAGKNFVIYNTDGNHGAGENSALKDIGGNLYRTTLKWTVGTAANTRIVLYMIPNTVNTESTIEWITMVKGNVGTNDWVPAPEDPVTSVNGTTGAVEISDRNLLPESKTLHGWLVTGAGIRSKKDGFDVVSWTGTDTKVKSVYKSITVKKGIYTFSAFIKKTSDTEIIFWPTANVADKPKFKYPENVRITGITDVYQRISVTYEVLVDDVTTNPRFEPPGYAGEYSVYAPKLQHGNIATDWSPALEDIVTSVNGGSGDVELGGRNLLPGTKDFTHQYKINGDLDSEKYLGFTVAHANAKQTSGYIDLYWSDDIPRRKYGEDLTLSFWVKGSGVVNLIHYSVVGDLRAAFAESSKGNTVNGGNIQIPITDSWERVWAHFRMGTDGDLSVPRPFIIRCVQGSEIYICGVKAEFGTRPTDWTPAPEDLFPITGGTVTGSITATNGFVGDVTGNAATATKLAAGKNISISGGATAAAKSFDGTAAIDLAVTALDVSKATAGTLPVARGGTGTTALVGNSGLIKAMFDTDLYQTAVSNLYAPVFTTSWADGGYLSLQVFRSAIGLGNTTGPLPVANGGTGAMTAAAALSGLGGQPKHKTLSLTLAVATWSASNTYTITATGVTASNTVIVCPAPASFEAWGESGVRCTAQGANSLTFTATDKPTVALTAQVLILD